MRLCCQSRDLEAFLSLQRTSCAENALLAFEAFPGERKEMEQANFHRNGMNEKYVDLKHYEQQTVEEAVLRTRRNLRSPLKPSRST